VIYYPEQKIELWNSPQPQHMEYLWMEEPSSAVYPPH